MRGWGLPSLTTFSRKLNQKETTGHAPLSVKITIMMAGFFDVFLALEDSGLAGNLGFLEILP